MGRRPAASRPEGRKSLEREIRPAIKVVDLAQAIFLAAGVDLRMHAVIGIEPLHDEPHRLAQVELVDELLDRRGPVGRMLPGNGSRGGKIRLQHMSLALLSPSIRENAYRKRVNYCPFKDAGRRAAWKRLSRVAAA